MVRLHAAFRAAHGARDLGHIHAFKIAQQKCLALPIRQILQCGFERRHGFVELKAQGQVPGPVHQTEGQEAVGIGTCAALDENDYVVGYYRSYAEWIYRGSDLRRLAAEILGRTRGSVGWATFYGLFVLAVAIHAPIGLRTVAGEWLQWRGRAADVCCVAVGVLLLALGWRAVAAVTL